MTVFVSFRPQGEILYPSDSKISQSCLLRNDRADRYNNGMIRNDKKKLSFRPQGEILRCRKDISPPKADRYDKKKCCHIERRETCASQEQILYPSDSKISQSFLLRNDRADRYNNGMIRNDKKKLSFRPQGEILRCRKDYSPPKAGRNDKADRYDSIIFSAF